jgi:hypothetical protein
MKKLLPTFAVVAGLALAVPMLAQRSIAPSITSGPHSGYPAASITSGMHSGYPAASILTPSNNVRFGGARHFGFSSPRMFNPQGEHREHRGDRDNHRFRDGFYSYYPAYYYDPFLYGYDDPYVENNSSLPGAGTFNNQAQPQEPANDAQYPQYRPYVESNSVVDSQGHIYDRRPESPPETAAAEPAQPPLSRAQEDEPRTVLVFKDGRQLEVSNYAIMGSNLYLFAGDHRKISLTDLDLNATRKANDDRGIEFRVPDPS